MSTKAATPFVSSYFFSGLHAGGFKDRWIGRDDLRGADLFKRLAGVQDRREAVVCVHVLLDFAQPVMGGERPQNVTCNGKSDLRRTW